MGERATLSPYTAYCYSAKLLNTYLMFVLELSNTALNLLIYILFRAPMHVRAPWQQRVRIRKKATYVRINISQISIDMTSVGLASLAN